MWLEEGKGFKAIVHRAGQLYNETLLLRKLGAPVDLWKAGREMWDKLIEHA